MKQEHSRMYSVEWVQLTWAVGAPIDAAPDQHLQVAEVPAYDARDAAIQVEFAHAHSLSNMKPEHSRERFERIYRVLPSDSIVHLPDQIGERTICGSRLGRLSKDGLHLGDEICILCNRLRGKMGDEEKTEENKLAHKMGVLDPFYCPKCGSSINTRHGNGTRTCGSCGHSFTVKGH